MLVPLALAERGRLNDMLDNFIAQAGASLLGPEVSLIQTHVDQAAQHTLTSSSRTTYRDMDCDLVEGHSDSIERNCDARRYETLKEVAGPVQENERNRTALLMDLQSLNVSWLGDPLTLNAGMKEIIQLQARMIYGGHYTKADGSAGYAAGLTKHAVQLGHVSTAVNNAMEAVMDTAWTNMVSVMNRLRTFIEDFQITDFLDAVSNAMLEAEYKQGFMMKDVNVGKGGIIDVANHLLNNVTTQVNENQPTFSKAVDELTVKKDALTKTQTADNVKASQRLEEVTDFFQMTMPQKIASYIDRMNADGRTIVKTARDDFFKSAQEFGVGFKKDVDKMASVFALDTQGVLMSEQADWSQAAGLADAELRDKYKQLSRKTESVISDTRLDDAAEMIGLNDLVVNFTDKIDSSVYAGQDAIFKVQGQLKDLRTTVDSVGHDGQSELDNIVQGLQDGVGSQKDKIAKFLKLSSDSNAAELSALVLSASRMRDALGSGQSAAYAEMSSLIANLQVKLAKKAEQENAVSADVKKALSLGKETSDAKLKALQDYQAASVGQTGADLQQSAADVLEWLQSASVSSGDGSGTLNRDMTGAGSAATAAVAAAAALEQERAVRQIEKLRTLARAGGEGSSKSLSDASAAAKAILDSLKSVRGGAASLSAAMADRNSALSGKMSALAEQLGMSDESAARMFESLMKTAASDADSKISTLLSQKLSGAQNGATKSGSAVSSIHSSVDDVLDQTDVAQSQALAIEENFKAKLGQLSGQLDAQFADRSQRDNAIRSNVERGLTQTRSKLSGEAQKAFEAVLATRQALADDTVVQLDQDLQSVNGKVAASSKLQFATISDALGDINGPNRVDAITTTAKLRDDIAQFSKFFNAMSAVSTAAASDFGGMETLFGQRSTEIQNGLMNNSLVDVSALERAKDEMKTFVKQAPRRISEQLKIIEDSFVSTEQQLAFKAKMLEAAAEQELSDAERASLDRQRSNLAKSQSLLTDFKTVETQALREVFSRESGLLGQAGGTVGDLNQIAGSISSMLNNNDKMNDRVKQALAKSSADVGSMQSAMKDAVNATQTKLDRELKAAAGQAGFSANITNAQMGSVVDSANRDSDLAQQVAGDIDEGSQQAVAEKQARLAALASLLQNNQGRVAEASRKTLATVGQSDIMFKDAIAGNAAERDQQLIMVKHAVAQLLQTWLHYTQAQSRKFTRWNSTEDEYVGQFMGTLGFLNQSALDEASKTAKAVQLDADESWKAFNAFVDLRNRIESSINQTEVAAQALNVSTENSADQVGQEIFRIDSTDKNIDEEARATATDEAAKTTHDADMKAHDVLASFAPKATSLIEVVGVETSDEVLRDEVAELESELRQN